MHYSIYKTKREALEVLRAQLDNERQSFVPHWRELSDYILPRRSRFQVSDANKGDRRNQKIIDSTATLAARTLSSGMMSGITSPARPWFRLTTPDPELSEYGTVKEWLHDVTQRMGTVFLRSNIYNVLPTTYADIGTFATSPIAVEEDFDEVVRGMAFPVGSYWIACDHKGRVNTFHREFRMTIAQLMEKFWDKELSNKENWAKFSTTVKHQYDASNYQTWIDVCHTIRPNPEFDERMLPAKFKKFESCYYEKGSGSLSTASNYMANEPWKYLRESGYDYFPILCPRWEVTAEDVYGTNCPGMVALGDIKQLQIGEKRGLQAIEKMVNPPMKAPSVMKTAKTSILPGDITYIDESNGQEFRPAHEVNFRLVELENKQAQVRDRIRRAYFEDLFLMLANTDRRQITAREIEERHDEKLLALGPVLEQLNQDLLDPLIDTTFTIMERQGLIPPPPEELQGMDLKVEYISIMAQAQKLVGISSIERFAGFVGNIAAQVQDPQILDKVDIDQMIDEYGDAVGVGPRIVRTDEKVEEIRASRAKAQQAQVMAQQATELSGAAKNLSQTDMEGDNALTRMMDRANAGALVESAVGEA